MNLEQIDTSTTAGKARVMQLAAEGRRVATQDPFDAESVWTAIPFPAWDWVGMTYAIIAEPVGPEEVWVIVDEGKVAISTFKPDHGRGALIADGHDVVRYIRADLAGDKG